MILDEIGDIHRFSCPNKLLAYAGLDPSVYQSGNFKAKKTKMSKLRIRETTLLGLAVLGGSIGAWSGMKIWHHKTLHKKFKYGVPAIIIVQITLIGYLLKRWLGN